MEFDSVSLDSDEGVELTIDENGGYYSGDIPCVEEENQQFILEAKTVYLLLPKNIPVSRAARVQWLLDHLNSVITLPTTRKLENSTEIEVLSIVPREQLITKCNKFQITCRSELKFLANSYRIVYCLDMSPSQANVDIQKGQILFDEIFNCFKNSVEGLAKKFVVPGNSLVFQPGVYLTIMVNTPFFMSPAQQVLVKGVEINSNNLPDIIKYVGDQFKLMEGKIADVASLADNEMSGLMNHNEDRIGGLVNPASERFGAKVPMVSPDANFVNMLRYSMLAVSLLPENSLSHILVVTDGVVAMPDSNILESLLFQLHYDCISVSFLKVGSPFHPHSSSGLVSYADLLYFFAHSTLGTCSECTNDDDLQPFEGSNVYHERFLVWTFHTRSRCMMPKPNCFQWVTENELFRGHRKPNLLTKRQAEEKSSASVLLLLSRRLREGFTVDHISYINGVLEIKMSLEWKSLIFIYYKVATQWPVTKGHSTPFEIIIAAPYEFLHDITCLMKKENKSSYRAAIIERFWLRLSQLTSEVGFAQQLSTFPTSSFWYNLSESARSGIPVFVMNNLSTDSTTKPNLLPNDLSCPKFYNLWQPICQMEGNSWRKWFHMHKISLLLKHDQQLPKGLHLSQSSRRYQMIQCRQAASALYGFLSEWSTFILIDNNTYLKLIRKDPDKPPISFCIIRVTSKLPCAVLHVGFLTPTPGYLRKEILEQLRMDLSSLAYAPGPLRLKENSVCVVFEKPLEKVLIRYERMPHDFSTVIFPDGTQPPHTTLSMPSPLTGSLFTTLSRYLYHKRCIWEVSYSANSKLSDNALSWILNTVTKMRLEEGFHFAHSSAGIVTMVMELWMEPFASCLVQYVLFPANYNESNGCGGDSNSSSDDENGDDDSETELQLVTEVWIEPQYGKVHTPNKRINYFNDKYYYEIANVISQIDHECINTLLTMEHLSLMCQERSRTFSLGSSTNLCSSSSNQKAIRKNNKVASHDQSLILNESQWFPILAPRIEHIPFHFDPIAILPFCQQTELLFSLFIESSEKTPSFQESDISKANKILMDNIHDHFFVLHDTELDLTREESDQFMRQVIQRHNHVNPCPIVDFKSNATEGQLNSQWRCLLKGISVTHVILTFIPATLDDLKALLSIEKADIAAKEYIELSERPPSQGSNVSDVPINVGNNLKLPVYVYDCPLAMLVNAHVRNLNDNFAHNKDAHEDHTFKFGDFIHEDNVRLKEDDLSSPEPKSEESDCSDPKNNARLHCRALVLAYSKSFVLSLFVALHFGAYIDSYDIQSAMDQCEEIITEIDITNYITTVCGHVKNLKEDKIDIQMMNEPTPCGDLKQLHHLIKEKFFQVMSQWFHPIPTNDEFYFCRYATNRKRNIKENDSDDDISTQSEINELRHDTDPCLYLEGSHRLQRTESGFSTTSDVLMCDVYPLFLHLICTVRYNNGGNSNISVKVLPTCLAEVIKNISDTIESLEKSKLQVSLDIFCLTLPNKVQNVITEYSSKGLRTTSFCSDGFQPSIGSPASDVSSSEIQDPEPLVNLPDYQKKAIFKLRDEIKWLLKDEIATALLDIEPVTLNTLSTIVHHVSHSTEKTSCDLEKINLNFVSNSNNSYDVFVKEFSKIRVPPYKLCKKDDYYYLIKENSPSQAYPDMSLLDSHENYMDGLNDAFDISRPLKDEGKVKDETASQPSDVSSGNGSVLTDGDGGYDEDVSEEYEDCEWLTILDKKRPNLPNFWLIMKVDHDVTIYFHCRFLEVPTLKVGIYPEVQRSVIDAIKELCRRVNQSLLLQSLYDTKICDPLLEPDDSFKEWHPDFVTQSVRATSYNRLKSLEGLISENNDEGELVKFNTEAYSKFKVGEFGCPIVWQTHFILHPRLKTGPGKSIISRGILALKNILDKFSVSNRNNMFVYKDQTNNVFYLRLQENMETNSGKLPALRPNEYETATVSRSPSIVSLPLGHKTALGQSDASISSSASSEIRPRVRSFGEKESKNNPNEDTLILRVHGITAAGQDVQCDLVQVLQNRLDDAVLEFLSITLARNAMCPLTPEDVHFIQKPFRLPEVVIRLTVEEFAVDYLESFVHYLRQNLLQFLNIPKYTDVRSHYHFKDFPENDSGNNIVLEDNIFIYNQSQNPSSGNRGIACIALNLINNSNQQVRLSNDFKIDLERKQYKNIISTRIIKKEGALPEVFIEFRIWKQGRVNIENLEDKLNSTVCQSAWDLVMEYFLLTEPLCIETNSNCSDVSPITLDASDLDLSKEIEFNVIAPIRTENSIKARIANSFKTYNLSRNKKRTLISPKRNTSRSITFDGLNNEKQLANSKKHNYRPAIELNAFETGNEGILTDTYSKYLPDWLEYGVSLSVPAVRKHRVTLSNRHLPCICIRELLNLIQDSPRAFHAIPNNSLKMDDRYKYIVYTPSTSVQKCVIISRNFEHWKSTISYKDRPDLLEKISSHVLKHTQKFTPLTANIFVPRQKILWAFVESDSVVIYTYNWTKEKIDKLISNCTNLGLWLSVRSCFLNSMTAQKLGLFHNQHLTRKQFLSSNNPYACYIGEIEYIRELPKDIPKRSIANTNLGRSIEVFRDAFQRVKHPSKDIIVVLTVEMEEIRLWEEKWNEEMKKLHLMYQSRTSSTTVPLIYLLIQNSRIIHYCHTPLLFLPRWRLKSASTRDHTLYPSSATEEIVLPQEESWHTDHCYAFFCEYRRYLQTLGFMPLQFDSNRKPGLWTKDSSSHHSIFYIQKTILGGILLFTAEFIEPFFATKLHAIECNRLQNISSRASINRFTLSFLDECDRVKIYMHLHSFTYDYHLRCIYNYISNNATANRICENYYINQFLEDFLKYYNKAPNFARNLVHQDVLTIKDLLTEGEQLFQYLLQNVNQYNFRAIKMEKTNGDIEQILVQVTTTSQVYYTDSQDSPYTDDFEVTLIVHNLCYPYRPNDNILHLKYYLILTSKRELYPASGKEEKLGKFRTVSSASRNILGRSSQSEEFTAKRITTKSVAKIEQTEEISCASENENEESDMKTYTTDGTSIEISTEEVNYLGYYSSHEQLMQQLILEKAKATQKNITDMVTKGMVHCRSNLLWNKLVSNESYLTYNEFIELKTLANLELLCNIHPNLGPLLNQPVSWYEGLSKLLLVKYNEHKRCFISPDGNIQHFVILHPSYYGAFMLLSLDIHMSRGDLYAVYREIGEHEDEDVCHAYQKQLLDGFVNCIVFYLWSEHLIKPTKY